MGLFSRRKNEGFDPDLWSDADERAKQRGGASWFADLDVDDSTVDDIETNSGASFEDADADWLGDDPGDAVRAKR